MIGNCTRGSQWTSGLALVALLALFAFQPSAYAQPRTEDPVGGNFWTFTAGFVPGQKVRFTFFQSLGAPVRAQVRLFNGAGINVYQSAQTDVPARGFATLDVDRNMVADSGDLATGRVEALAIAIVAPASGGSPDGTSNTIAFGEWKIGATAQVVDITTGETTILPSWVQKVRDSGPPPATVGLPRNHRLLFIAHGTTLNDAEPIGFQVRLDDASGRTLAESPVTPIPLGAFGSIAFDRADLRVVGEPDGRVETTPPIQLYCFANQTLSPSASDSVVVSVEVVNNATGESRVYIGAHFRKAS
jgi:hypothetical protein